MIPEKLVEHSAGQLSEKFGKAVHIGKPEPLGGGCINECYRLPTDAGDFFLKYNFADTYPGMFEAESKGLEILAKAEEIRVPEVVLFSKFETLSYLIMHFIASGSPGRNFWELFGDRLAALHKHSADFFGLNHDNYIGSLYQSNKPKKDWNEFFILERLEKQIQLATDDGKLGGGLRRRFEKLYKTLTEIFPVEKPALLHGDLWSGNYMIAANGEPCIIDPAVYYGHREVDLAMTRLFGGFDKSFYVAYDAAFPLEKGWQERVDIFNLYPLLVHVNLFGGGYLSSVEGIMRKF